MKNVLLVVHLSFIIGESAKERGAIFKFCLFLCFCFLFLTEFLCSFEAHPDGGGLSVYCVIFIGQ